jgi:RND family efflux transporter MFP subunit
MQPRVIRLLVLLAAVWLSACSKAESTDGGKSRPAPLVVASKVEVRDVPVEIRAPVDLRPLEQADVGSKILGYIDAVLVDRGDLVKKGQLVALVRPSDLPDQLTAARAGYGQTQASLGLARTNLERAQKLAPSGVVSQQELQNATSALASAEAQEGSAKAQISVLATRLGETRIQSPIDGVVSQRRLDPGALVGPPGGGAIVTVVRMDRLRVFITANEYEAAGLAIGKDAHVELDAMPGKSYLGKVVRVSPSFDPVTRTIDAEVQFDNTSGELRPGMYGRGSIIVEVHPAAVVVPAAAVQISSGNKYVFVLAKDKVARRPITTGVDGGNWLEVTAGLAPGAEVITAGADGLSDGSAVRVVKDVDPYSAAKVASPSSASSATPKRD